MPFQKGNKLAKGGARDWTGPAKKEIKQKFQEILHKSNAHKRFQIILEKEPNQEIFLKAYQVCLDRAYGKPVAELEGSGDNSVDIAVLALLIQRVRNPHVAD